MCPDGDLLLRAWAFEDDVLREDLDACDGGDVLGVATSPNGAILAAAGADERVTLWSPYTGEEKGASD